MPRRDIVAITSEIAAIAAADALTASALMPEILYAKAEKEGPNIANCVPREARLPVPNDNRLRTPSTNAAALRRSMAPARFATPVSTSFLMFLAPSINGPRFVIKAERYVPDSATLAVIRSIAAPTILPTNAPRPSPICPSTLIPSSISQLKPGI